MATTVTIPDELAVELTSAAASRNLTLTEAVTVLLRRALEAEGAESQSEESFVIRPRAIGLRAGCTYDDIEDLVEYGEGALHR
jgi:hypothetical protein